MVMLTLFAVPKAFRGSIKTIQTNALKSWTKLHPPCEIILFGDEDGIAEAASCFGVRHVPNVARNEYGTPLLDDVFLKAQAFSIHDILCYLNADIIVLSDLVEAVGMIRKRSNAFLMTGRRWNINMEDPLDVSNPCWENQLRAYARQSGRPTPPEWIDYFVFPRGFYKDLLPFALGRVRFDNWLLWKARSLKAPIIDASEAIMVIHQNHDYSHHPEGQKGVWEGPEAQRNRDLMGGWHHCFTLADATHRLTPTGLKLNLGKGRWIQAIMRWWHWLIERTFPFRKRLGLGKASMGRS